MIFIYIYILYICLVPFKRHILYCYIYMTYVCVSLNIYICILFMFVDIHFTNLSFFQDMYIYICLFTERDFYYVYYFFLAGGVDNT